MDKEQPSEFSAQERFILQIRECAGRLAYVQEREQILSDCAKFFADFAGSEDVLIIDLSRDSLDLYRSAEAGAKDQSGATVILEESVAPLFDLLRDRYMSELGIRIFNRKILEAPEGIEEDLIAEALEQLGMAQGFILPLTVARNFGTENVMGILLINNVPSHRFADPAHLALLRMAADLLSVTADNMDLGNSLARLRPNDLMTGLASRNRFASQLAQEVSRAEFLNRTFALVLVDIDNFKSLAIRQGYRYGDLVVKTVADDILLEARPIDLVCRWGSKEFIILLPELSSKQALEFAERCRNKIGAHAITPDDYREEIFVGTSFGIVVYPEHGRNSEVLLRHAELALLHAQLSGRNQSALWSDKWLAADA